MTTDTRIESLESQVRTLERMIIAMKDSVSLLMAQRASGVIRAKKFEVENNEGKLVGVFRGLADGGELWIGNSDGKPVVVGAVTDAGMGELSVRDNTGMQFAVIRAKADGMGYVVLVNDNNDAIAGIFESQDGGHLGTYNVNGRHVAAIGANAEGGFLNMSNREGADIVSIGAQSNGSGAGAVNVHNRAGIPVAEIAATEDGNGVVVTLDSSLRETSRMP